MALAVGSRSWLGATLGEALLLISLGSLQVFMAVATGPIPRRRAFQPHRLREASAASISWLYSLAFGGAVLALASVLTAWVGFLDGRKHAPPSAGTYGLWLSVAVLGFLAAAVTYAANKDGALRVSAGLDARLSRLEAAGAAVLGRYLFAPAMDIVGRSGEWIPAADGGLGRAMVASGRLVAGAARAPMLPLLLLLGVLLALVLGLVSPGVLR